uniref:TLDc domain-containing protein n=1 Tax=Echinostoma caproni TaxID=27848 RepID=A0A183B5H1_9TREM
LSCTLSENADLLLYLLNVKEIQSQVQLIPSIISLAYRALRDGEALLAKTSGISDCEPVPMFTAPFEDSKSPNTTRTTAKSGDGDEGEEGEVLGDDDDEDEATLEPKNSASDSNSSKRTLTICKYRRVLAYALLPITYQMFDTVKIDRRLMEKIVNLSFNFIFESVAYVTDQPLVFGSEQKYSESSKPPMDYLIDCLKMSATILQWPLNLFTKHESIADSSSNSNDKTMKSPSELITILDESWEEILSDQKQMSHSVDTEVGSRRRRSAQRREDIVHSSAKISSLAHQSIVLFWSLLLNTAVKYVSFTRPCFMQNTLNNKEKSSVSSYPVDMSILFSSSPITEKPISLATSNTTFPILVHLLQYRKYKEVPENYTLGSHELNLWDAAIRPSHRSSRPSSVPSLEEIVCFDLTLSGILRAPWMPRCLDSDGPRDVCLMETLIASVCPQDDQKFVRWILCAYSFNPFSQKPWNDLIRNREDFVRNMSSVAVEASKSDYHPIRTTETCWFVQFTEYNVIYLGCKVIAHWLCSNLSRYSGSSNAVAIDAACLACIIYQVDTVEKQSAFLSELWPAPYQTMLKLVEDKWSDVRVRFLNWILPPTSAVADSSLINEFVLIEAAWLVKTETSTSDFMDACVACMKSPVAESIHVRLRRFVQTESNNILLCLKDLSGVPTQKMH